MAKAKVNILEENILYNDLINTVDDIVANLSESNKDTYIDHYIEHLDTKKIAEKYNIGRDAARKRLSRLNIHIREALGKVWVDGNDVQVGD